jgi:MFS family permease
VAPVPASERGERAGAVAARAVPGALPGDEMSALALRDHPAFARLWFARLASVSAAQMMAVAIGWQMYEITGSAWDLGLTGLLQFLPTVPLMFVAGPMVDRLHRGRMLAACMAALFGVAAALAGANATGAVSREILLQVSAILGVIRAFQMPTQQAITPALVPPAVLPQALSFSAAGMEGAVIAGPALGGALYLLGPGALYGVCAALFAGACVLALGIRYDHAPRAAPITLDTLVGGLRFVAGNPVILGAITLDLFAVLLGGATALLPIFARDILMTGPIGLGLLRAAPAVGALAMSLALTRWPLRRHTGPALLGAVAVFGASQLTFGLSTVFGLSWAALAVSGAADMVSVVIRQTLVQLETPDEVRGRVSAVNGLFIGASNQLGEFESGATAHAFGPVGSVVVGGVGAMVIAGLWFRLFPSIAQRDRLVDDPAS